MKDQYFGDISDYRKYCILSKLSGLAGFPIFFAWMLTPPDGRPDGEKIRYLHQPEKWRSLNPALFDFLRKHVLELKERRVSAFRNAPGFSKAKHLETELTKIPSEQNTYFADVRKLAGQKDIVFFDPDNGLEVKTVAEGRTKSVKHLYWRDLSSVYAAGHSVITYQHFPRENRVVYTRRMMKDMEKSLKNATAFAIRTPHVLFLIASQLGHETKIAKALQRSFKPDHRFKTGKEFEFTNEFASGK